MTYKPLTESRGEELLMLYLAGFHAKTLAQQEKAQELTGNEAGCGEKWRASFTRYDPDSSLWRTHQCSLLGGLDEFLETWPQWGLMRDGECWEQQMLAQTIRGTESGLSPNGVDSFHTPNTTGLDGGSNSRKALKLRQEKLPTPTASDYKSQPTSKSWKAKGAINFKLSNPEIQAMWPTPVKSDHSARRPSKGWSGKSDLPSVVWTETGGKENPNMSPAQLNATWVEWLMGWPLGWTDLKPLEMDKSHCVPQPHGEP
jgi:DNA (cytosine-5)-methyltransferase 1